MACLWQSEYSLFETRSLCCLSLSMPVALAQKLPGIFFVSAPDLAIEALGL